MKEKKNSEEKKILLQKDSNVKKTINVKDTILALKNNDNFIIVLEIIIILALVVALVFIIGGQKNTDDKNQSYTYMDSVSNYFNTYIKIIGYEKNQDEFTEVGQEAADLIGEYHRLFDIYNDYYTCPKCDKLVGFKNDESDDKRVCNNCKHKLEFSDIIVNLSVLNNLVDGQHQNLKVDKKIIDMLLYAKEMYNLTGGKMNVAMGSVLSIWHDYRDAGINQPVKAELPPMDKLQEAAKHTDINSIVIDEVNSTVWISDPYTKLDVGAIAKGYAVERVAEMLEEKGKTSYTLEVGGNIRTIGYKGNGDKWRAGIRDPKGDMYEYNEYVELANESIVTSGSYERYYIVYTGACCRECDWIYNQNIGIPGQDISAGTRPGDLTSSVKCPECGSNIRKISEEFHHIIDKETLMPADRGYLSVSVICKDSGMGDGLSTALFCMDLDEALAFVNSLDGVEAMFVTEDEVKHYSNGFLNYTYTP